MCSYSFYMCYILMYVVFYLEYYVFWYCFVYCFSFCIQLCLHQFVQLYRTLPIGGNAISVNKYHIILHHIATSNSQLIALNFIRIIPSNHIVCSMCSKTQNIFTPTAIQFKQKERLTARSVSISW